MKDSSPWDANLRVIRGQYPGLAEQLEGAAAEAGLENLVIEASAAGPPTLIVNGVHVHSPRDPVREGRRLAESLSPGGAALILGFGLGYAAEALGELDPERPLIIVEPRPALLKKALESRDLSGFLEKRRLIFVTGRESGGLSAALGLFEGGPRAILRNRALTALDEAWYAETERRLQSLLSKDQVNLATLRRFGKRWTRNLAANREAIRDLPGVDRLGGLLQNTGIPVFLAAAGPSLDRIRPLVKEISQRCLLVAVDTSLRFLLDAGADPDFTLVVDPQFWNCRHLDHAPAPRTCLVAESAVYPPVLRHPFSRAFLCGSLFPLGRFIEDRTDPKGQLGAGGSVATTAWDFARLLGAERVYLAGLDLGFPGLKTHFKGARFEEKALSESDRLDPPETRSVRALRDGQPFRAQGAGEESILTDRRLSLYAAWFEDRFRRFPHIRNYRLGGGGLAIAGLASLEPEDILKLPPRRPEINQKLEEAFTALDRDFCRDETAGERNRRYTESLETLIRGLETVKTIAETAARRAEEAMAAPPRGPARDRLLGELDAALRRLTESAVKDAAGFLFPPAAELEAALQTPPGEGLKRHLEFTAQFHRALAEAAAYPLNLLRIRK